MGTTSTSSGWNRSTSTPKPAPKKPSAMRGVVAGLVVVALAAVCVVVFMGKGEKTVEKVEKKPTKIKDVTPAAALTNAVPAKPIDPREDYDHTKMYRDEEGILRWNSGARAYDPTRSRLPPLTADQFERQIFKHGTDRVIADLLDAVPGERRFFTPDYYSKNFERSFLASLKDEIIITDDDRECDRQLKLAMIDARKELKSRMDRGEKLGDILTQTSQELQRLGEYKDQLQAEVRKIIKDGGANGDKEFSEKDIRDLVGAANKMLEDNGCNPISADQMMMWNIRMNARRLGMDSTQKAEAIRAYKNKIKNGASSVKDAP